MTQLARVFSTQRQRTRARSSPRECEPVRPASFAEIVAASAFLDFGGIPSGDCRPAWEASIESDRRLRNEELLSAKVGPRDAPVNKYIDESLDREKTIFDPHRPQHLRFYPSGRFPLSQPRWRVLGTTPRGRRETFRPGRRKRIRVSGPLLRCVVSNFKSLWQEDIGKVAPVYLVSLFDS
jgi:hypothetical protein